MTNLSDILQVELSMQTMHYEILQIPVPQIDSLNSLTEGK